MKHSLEISKADFEIARYKKDTEGHRKIRWRMHMIYLSYLNYTQKQIGEVIGVKRITLWRWGKIYKEGGIEGLRQLHYKGQQSKLHAHKELIKESIEQTQPQTRAEIQELVEKKQEFGAV